MALVVSRRLVLSGILLVTGCYSIGASSTEHLDSFLDSVSKEVVSEVIGNMEFMNLAESCSIIRQIHIIGITNRETV